MNRLPVLASLALAISISSGVVRSSRADPPDILRDYRFITSRSTVHVTGGFAGWDMDLSIRGRFGLVTGYEYGVDPATHVPTLAPYAQFVDVDAILFNPLSMAPMPVPGWDLDQTLNFEGLDGNFQSGNPLQFLFTGNDGQGWPIRLKATMLGRLLHIVGENEPGCCDFYHYRVDALAYQKPFPDWDLDDTIGAADYVSLRKFAGLAEEFEVWHEMFDATATEDGAIVSAAQAGTQGVPEPAAFVLFLLGTVALAGVAIRRASRRSSA